MNKYFTYQFEMNKFSGYRVIIEKEKFALFKKIVYEGFKIMYSTSDIIHFEIDTQLIRKLKLLKLNEQIKINSIEDTLTQLLENSKENSENSFTDSLRYYFYNYNDARIVEDIYEKIEEKRERNRFLMNQSRMNNRRVKMYENKNRFRK